MNERIKKSPRQSLEMTGNIAQDKTAFYELAKSHVKFQTSKENIDWNKKNANNCYESATSYSLATYKNRHANWTIKSMEVVVNKEWIDYLSERSGENFSAILPYIIEHETYEAWLEVRQGISLNLSKYNRHLLARQREYYLAEKDGLGESLLRFAMKIDPHNPRQHIDALNHAKKRLKHDTSKELFPAIKS